MLSLVEHPFMGAVCMLCRDGKATEPPRKFIGVAASRINCVLPSTVASLWGILLVIDYVRRCSFDPQGAAVRAENPRVPTYVPCIWISQK